jgi:hypothetical protein
VKNSCSIPEAGKNLQLAATMVPAEEKSFYYHQGKTWSVVVL